MSRSSRARSGRLSSRSWISRLTANAQHGRSDAHPGARHVRALVPHRLRHRRGEVRRCLHGKHQLDERRAPSSGARAVKEKSAMKPRFLVYTVTLLAVIAVLTAPMVARAADPDWKAVEQALGKSGQLQPGDVFRIGMPRTDLNVTVKGVPVKAGFALGSYAAFKQLGDHAMVMGDLVLLDQEVPAVMSGLLAGGLDVTAVHNHLNEMSPHVMYVHYEGHGDAVRLAAALRQALSASGTPLGAAGAPPAASGGPVLDTKQVEQVLGRSGRDIGGGVYQVTVPRAEAITAMGQPLLPAMGVVTVMNFQPTADGKAAITGDFVLVDKEVNAVARTLRQHGIDVTALHNHGLMDTPRLFYMHFWGNDDAVKLARALRAALDQTNSQK